LTSLITPQQSSFPEDRHPPLSVLSLKKVHGPIPPVLLTSLKSIIVATFLTNTTLSTRPRYSPEILQARPPTLLRHKRLPTHHLLDHLILSIQEITIRLHSRQSPWRKRRSNIVIIITKAPSRYIPRPHRRRRPRACASSRAGRLCTR
jgi:hypothetical protein